ncbi:MAG: hypothetical protein Q9163_006016 [Psora crenata]
MMLRSLRAARTGHLTCPSGGARFASTQPTAKAQQHQQQASPEEGKEGHQAKTFEASSHKYDSTPPSSSSPPAAEKAATKTQAEADAELRQKLESISGDGGEAGMELENGRPVAMKRGVKNNMFRLI